MDCLRWIKLEFALIMMLGMLVSCGVDDNSTKAGDSAINGDSAKSKSFADCELVDNTMDINWSALMHLDCPRLSDYNLFMDVKNPTLNPRQNGYKYELTQALFSDYAYKDRFIFLPEGEAIRLSDQYPIEQSELGIEYPLGTVITKTFSFEQASGARQIVETRLLIKRSAGWVGLPYVWNEEGTDALLRYGGSRNLDVDLRKVNGELVSIKYDVPTTQECQLCHGTRGSIKPIGPSRIRFLSKQSVFADGSQNSWITKRLFEYYNQRLTLNDFHLLETDSLAQQARDYLDINCSYCHQPDGYAANTRFYLESWRPMGRNLGLCKEPVAAGAGSGGLPWVIAPKDPESSILWYRLNSDKNAAKMPEVGRMLIHEEGVELVAAWIKNMNESTCVR
jgi:uncharacterized repeat protein (TIGR03806 family)